MSVLKNSKDLSSGPPWPQDEMNLNNHSRTLPGKPNLFSCPTHVILRVFYTWLTSKIKLLLRLQLKQDSEFWWFLLWNHLLIFILRHSIQLWSDFYLHDTLDTRHCICSSLCTSCRWPKATWVWTSCCHCHGHRDLNVSRVLCRIGSRCPSPHPPAPPVTQEEGPNWAPGGQIKASEKWSSESIPQSSCMSTIWALVRHTEFLGPPLIRWIKN